ncbi:MAG: zinc metalloprotease, partial [Rhodocyclaceae bacterium]
MRLKDFNPGNIRVEDQRGMGGGMRFPGGGGGKLGCGSIIIIAIAALVFGVDPAQMLGGLQQVQQQGGEAAAPAQGGKTTEESCNSDPLSRESCAALASLNATWEPLFKEANIPCQLPKRVFYSQAGSSG